MENLWNRFKSLYSNDSEAKAAFEEVCTLILQQYFPNQKIEAYRQNFVNSIISADTNLEPPRIILHCKFVLDNLNNSRKGQVRKAFSTSYEILKKTSIPVSDWILCVPFKLAEEELSWWNNWSNKMTTENKLNIELFDGDRLINLLKEYNLYEKWFDKAQTIDIPVYTAEEADSQNQPATEEIIETPETTIQPVEETHKEQTSSSETLTNNQNTSDNQTIESSSLGTTEEQLKTVEDDLSKEDFIKLEDILNHAQDFEHQGEHEKALELYQYADSWFADTPEQKIDILKLKGYCELKVIFNTKLKAGDDAYEKKDFETAKHCYEEALKVDSKDKETVKRYNECFGEILLQQKKYQAAYSAFGKASEVVSGDAHIEKRKELALNLSYTQEYFKSAPAKLLNPVVAPYFYVKAAALDSSNAELNTKAKSIKLIALIAGVLLLLVIGFFVLKPFFLKKSKSNVQLTEQEQLLQKANFYAENAGPSTAHYYDSAIIAYSKILKSEQDNKDITKKLNDLKLAKESYGNDVQRNIKKDSAKYFVSLRKPTEGLRLFKYIYDQNNRTKGKYGFVDNHMNVIILPIFDFNYKVLNKKGETFTNGKAKVCLITSQKDTIYFYINKSGEKVEE